MTAVAPHPVVPFPPVHRHAFVFLTVGGRATGSSPHLAIGTASKDPGGTPT